MFRKQKPIVGPAIWALTVLGMATLVLTTAFLALAGGGNVARGIWTLQANRRGTPTPVPSPSVASSEQGFRVRLILRPTSTPTPTPTPAPAKREPSPISPPPPPTPPPRIRALAAEKGIDVSGRYIVVDQAEQRMYIVDGNVLVRILPVSTGDPEHGWFTPAWVGRVGVYWGTFGARGVYADNAWHLFKAPGGNILIHGVPYILDASGRKVYQDLDKLGQTPASRGCIRLRPEDARWFTSWGPAGVPIVILPHPLDKQ